MFSAERRVQNEDGGIGFSALRSAFCTLRSAFSAHVSGYAFCLGFVVPYTGILCGLSSIGVEGPITVSGVVDSAVITRRRAIMIAPTIATVRINPASSKLIT